MKQGLERLLYNFGKRFMGWTLHMIMCVLLWYPVSIHMSQLLSTGRPISSYFSFSGYFVFVMQKQSLCFASDPLVFITLRQITQWTIANPLGADRPAKQQKKSSYVSTGWTSHILCIL